MPTLVYAVFDDDAAADSATTELMRASGGLPAFLVQAHTEGTLDGNDLPESATEFGRNMAIGTLFGGVVGVVAGLIAALVFHVLPPGLGVFMGLLTGTMFGMSRGLMAGTRVPKQALRETIAELETGELMLTVDVVERAHVEHVEDVLDRHGASVIDHC